MIVHWRNTLVATCLVLFSVILVHSQAPYYDVRSLCPGVCPTRRPPASAEGVWWQILASNSSIGECGKLNNQCPCKCTGYKVCSYISPPYVHKYNLTTFGYDSERRCYDEVYQDLSLEDPNQPWSVYRVVSKSNGDTVISSFLDTDDFKSFVIIYLCTVRTADGGPFINVISRDIRGLTKKNQQRVDAVLRANNICPEELIVVSRRNCPRYV